MDDVKSSSANNVKNHDKINGCSAVLLIIPLFIVILLTIIPRIMDSYYTIQGYNHINELQSNKLFTGNIGNVGGIIFFVVVCFLLSVITPFFSCKYAKNHNKKIFDIFDKRWLPERGKVTETIEYGDKLEKVAIAGFWSTTVWDLITKIIPKSLLASFLSGISMIFVFTRFIKIPIKISIVLGLILGLSINVLISTFYCLIAEWKRTRCKVVIFTTRFYVVKVRADLIHFLFKSELAMAEQTRMDEIKEIRSARDPEDLNVGGIKTNIFRELLLKKDPNVLSLYIASHRKDAGDVLLWMEDGYNLLNLFSRGQVAAENINRARAIIEANAIELQYGDPNDKTWTKARGQQAAQQYLDRLPKRKIVYDVYRAENPDLDPEDTRLEEETPLEVGVSYDNVSGHFSEINPLRR